MKEFFVKNKSNIVFIIISLIIFILFILSFMWPMIPSSEDNENETTKSDLTRKEEPQVKTVLVDIKGQVKSPGVYEMETSERVNDVIKKAGGLTSSADTSLINLSQKVKDEMVIIVYSKDEVEEMTKEEPCVCPKNNDACINEDNVTEIIKEEDDTEEKGTSNKKISINTASKEELMTLDGIGEAKALAIIDYRTKNGNFEKIEDIMNVSGIGEAAFAKIKDQITV